MQPKRCGKVCFHPGSNWGSPACQADGLTNFPMKARSRLRALHNLKLRDSLYQLFFAVFPLVRGLLQLRSSNTIASIADKSMICLDAHRSAVQQSPHITRPGVRVRPFCAHHKLRRTDGDASSMLASTEWLSPRWRDTSAHESYASPECPEPKAQQLHCHAQLGSSCVTFKLRWYDAVRRPRDTQTTMLRKLQALAHVLQRSAKLWPIRPLATPHYTRCDESRVEDMRMHSNVQVLSHEGEWVHIIKRWQSTLKSKFQNTEWLESKINLGTGILEFGP